MTDEFSDAPETDTPPDQPALRPASENIWYVLATIAGERNGEKSAEWHNIQRRNRRYWNGMMRHLIGENRYTKLEKSHDSMINLPQLSDSEHELIEKALAKRGFTVKDIYPNVIDFSYVQFRSIDFTRYTLLFPSSFSGSMFSSKAEFEGLVFLSEVDFAHTKFSGDVNFKESSFLDEVNFYNSAFSQYADFSNVSFMGSNDLDSPTHSVSFVKAKFSDRVDFGGTKFNALTRFGNAKFSSVVSFFGCKFSKPVKFERVYFSSVAIFTNSMFAGWTVFTDANFLSQADFGSTKFSSWVKFDRAKFLSHPDFNNSIFEDALHFKEASFESSPPSFYNTKLPESISWTDTRFPPTQRLSISEADDHKDAYERLALMMDRLKKHHDQHRFFRLEMKARRAMEPNPFLKLMNWLYEELADYGYGFGRALAIWLGHIVAGAALLIPYSETTLAAPTLTSIGAALKLWGTALVTSFSNAHGFLGLNRTTLKETVATYQQADLLLPYNVTATAQAIVGVIFLFFLLLTARNRFRMG